MSQATEFVRMQPCLDPPPPCQEQDDAIGEYAQVAELIARARGTLAAHRQEAVSLPASRSVAQWDKCNFGAYEQLCAFLQVPPMLAEARDQHPVEAKSLFLYMEKCENELGALEIDIRRRTIAPEKATAQVQAIIDGCAEHKALYNSWLSHINKLLAADKAIRESLSLKALLPLAREQHKRNSELVEDGYSFYCLVKEEHQEDGNPTLLELKALASELEKKIRAIDLGGFTGLARAIIDHQLRVMLRATDQIKSFVEYFQQNPPGEILSVDKIEQELTALKGSPAPQILERLAQLIPTLARNLVDLRHKAKTLNLVRLLPLILNEVSNLQLSLKATILPEIRRRIEEPGSAVNPNTLAAEKTTEFFMGLKGFVRALKLLFCSLGGQRAIKASDLHRQLVEILAGCTIYYGNSQTEIFKLQSYIESKLSGIERPFPYDGLYALAKETLAAYGGRLEKLLFSFEVDDYTSDESEQSESRAVKTTMGRLIAKLEVRSANLESARN